MADSWKPKSSKLRKMQNDQRQMGLADVDGRVKQAAPILPKDDFEELPFNMHVSETPPDDIYLGRAWLDISDSGGEELDPVILDIPATVVGIGIYTTLVGGSSCVSTNDGGATYMRQHVGPISSGFTGYNDNINFPATPIPGAVTNVSFVTVTKGTDSRATGYGLAVGATLFLNTGAPDFDTLLWFGVVANGASDWTEQVFDLSVDDEGTPVSITKQMLEEGTVDYNPGSALLNDGMSATWTPSAEEFDSYWTYIALRVTYIPSPVAPGKLKIWTTTGWQYA